MAAGTAKEAAAALRGLARTVERLAYVPNDVAKLAAPRLTMLLRKQFASGVDPYNKPWKPLRPATLAKGRTPPPLTETGSLRDHTGAARARAGIRLFVNRPYGLPHQTGFRNARTGRRVVARPILPSRGLPAAWTQVLQRAAKEAFASRLRRRS
jgi:hypothetical protein